MNENTGTYRICKKCLMREQQDKADDFTTIQNLIENLDTEERASEGLYEERLQICKDCEMFLEAMCRSCGCYVELRAAKAANSCPRKKW